MQRFKNSTLKRNRFKNSNFNFTTRWVAVRIRMTLIPFYCESSVFKRISLQGHFLAGLGIRSFDFRANRSFFPKMSDSLTSLISSERPEQIAHGRSFLVSEMSDSLTSLISSERPERIAHGRSFLVSKMSDSLTSLI